MKPSSALDPCLSPSDAVAIKLKAFVLGEGNPLDGFLNKGELSQAVQLSLSVLKSTNEKTDCGQTLNADVKTLVRSRLFKYNQRHSHWPMKGYFLLNVSLFVMTKQMSEYVTYVPTYEVY